MRQLPHLDPCRVGLLRGAVSAFVCALAFAGAGCRSVSSHLERADRSAHAHIEDARERAGLAGPAPAWMRAEDRLRLRLIERNLLPPEAASPADPAATPEGEAPWRLTLADALRAGAGNSREYQDARDRVFRAALKLDTESDAFRTSFEGLLSGGWEDQRASGQRGVTGGAQIGAQRAWETGVVVASRLTLDVVKLLTLDRSSAYGLAWDASITVPLLRGAGREIVRERLTQAERELVYALWEFERFKRRHAVAVGQSYLRAIELQRQLLNFEENARSLAAVAERARELTRAGRLSEVQVSQAEQDELRARERRNRARNEVEQALDRFKFDLGLPVDARVVLVEAELDRLPQPSEAGPAAAEADWVARALAARLDLTAARYRLEDAARAIRIAEDALRMGLNFKGTAAAGGRRSGLSSATDDNITLRLDEGLFGASLSSDLPWNRVPQRNALRERLVDLESARRTIEQREDEIKLELRGGIRRLDDARDSYEIQQISLRLAQRRVENTRLQLQAGRAEMRDLLEAQESLLGAQNGVLSALIAYRVAEWTLLRDTEQLTVTEEGLSHDLL
jgi:outer membrane protein TolC